MSRPSSQTTAPMDKTLYVAGSRPPVSVSMTSTFDILKLLWERSLSVQYFGFEHVDLPSYSQRRYHVQVSAFYILFGLPSVKVQGVTQTGRRLNDVEFEIPPWRRAAKRPEPSPRLGSDRVDLIL